MDVDLTTHDVQRSLERLKDTFEGNYGQFPILDGDREVGRVTLEGQKVYLTFRGSVDSFLEILSCAHLRKVSPLKEWGLSGKVHAGIYHSFCRVQNSIDACLHRAFSTIAPQDREWILEGYSRGSALAMLSAAYLTQKLGDVQLKVLTYSTMNIFDEEAARDYDQKIKHHWNFLCTDDFFPRWIGSFCLGFHSVGTKLPFSGENSPSFLERVRKRVYTHLTRHWLISAIARFLIPVRIWEAHMPETYEDGALVALQRHKAVRPDFA